jgi:hypothetical protein
MGKMIKMPIVLQILNSVWAAKKDFWSVGCGLDAPDLNKNQTTNEN